MKKYIFVLLTIVLLITVGCSTREKLDDCLDGYNDTLQERDEVIQGFESCSYLLELCMEQGFLKDLDNNNS